MIGAGVDEEEEVVADQLHPVDGLFDRHPLGFELLRADDDRRVVRLVLVARDDRDLAGRDGAHDIDRGGLQVDARQLTALLLELGAARVVARIDALVLRAPQLLAQLVDRHVEGGELVGIRRLSADDRALAGERELDRVVFHPTVVIRAVSHLHVHALSAWRKVLYADGLVFDDRAEAIGDTHSHADDAGFHP